MRALLIVATVVTTFVAAVTAQQAVDPQFDQEAVERGHEVLVNQCGFCHGSNARGGSSGPDLTRSEVVQNDEGGKELSAFLRNGRPDKGMPSFELPVEQAKDSRHFCTQPFI